MPGKQPDIELQQSVLRQAPEQFVDNPWKSWRETEGNTRGRECVLSLHFQIHFSSDHLSLCSHRNTAGLCHSSLLAAWYFVELDIRILTYVRQVCVGSIFGLFLWFHSKYFNLKTWDFSPEFHSMHSKMFTEPTLKQSCTSIFSAKTWMRFQADYKTLPIHSWKKTHWMHCTKYIMQE